VPSSGRYVKIPRRAQEFECLTFILRQGYRVVRHCVFSKSLNVECCEVLRELPLRGVALRQLSLVCFCGLVGESPFWREYRELVSRARAPTTAPSRFVRFYPHKLVSWESKPSDEGTVSKNRANPPKPRPRPFSRRFSPMPAPAETVRTVSATVRPVTATVRTVPGTFRQRALWLDLKDARHDERTARRFRWGQRARPSPLRRPGTSRAPGSRTTPEPMEDHG
jgi:hypothetical protein